MLSIPASAFLALLFLPPLMALARRGGLVDRPGGRKRHRGNVPLVGGLAIYLSLINVGILDGEIAAARAILFAALAGGTIAAGLIDDLFDLPAWAKLAWQFTIAAIAILAGGPGLADAAGNVAGIHLGGFAPLLSALVYVAMMNAVNLLDGADGIAGGVGVVILGGLALLAGAGGRALPPLLPMLLGGILGFLCLNMPWPWRRRPPVFLGDAGSMLIGFAVAWFALDLHQAEWPPAPAMIAWLVALPLLDMGRVFVARLLRGVSPFTAGRDHLHHLLLDRGVPPLDTALMMTAIAASLPTVAAAALALGAGNHALLLALAGFGCVYVGTIEALRLLARRRPAEPVEEAAGGQGAKTEKLRRAA